MKKISRKKTGDQIKRKIISIVFRYSILVAIAVPGLTLFYFVFTPITSYPVYFILDQFYEMIFLSGEVPIFLINEAISIELVPACIAGAAYYLLLILNLSTPNIGIKKRISAITFSFVTFLIINIVRIVLLTFLAVSGSSYFDVTHAFFWYGLSTIIVIAIWFLEVKIFNLKEIPFYSDLKFLYKTAKN